MSNAALDVKKAEKSTRSDKDGSSGLNSPDEVKDPRMMRIPTASVPPQSPNAASGETSTQKFTRYSYSTSAGAKIKMFSPHSSGSKTDLSLGTMENPSHHPPASPSRVHSNVTTESSSLSSDSAVDRISRADASKAGYSKHYPEAVSAPSQGGSPKPLMTNASLPGSAPLPVDCAKDTKTVRDAEHSTNAKGSSSHTNSSHSSSHSQRRNKGDSESEIVPLGFVELQHVQHHKTKLTRQLSQELLEKMEEKGNGSSGSAFSLERGAKSKDTYSFLENTRALEKGRLISTRTRTVSESKILDLQKTTDAELEWQRKSKLFEEKSLSDPVHFQIDASHKVIYTSLSTLELDKHIKGQMENLLRTQMIFIHDAYKTYSDTMDKKLNVLEEENNKLQDDIRDLEAKAKANTAIEPKSSISKSTPSSSIFNLANISHLNITALSESIENLNSIKNGKGQDIEALRKENDQLRSYLEALISRIVENPETMAVLAVNPF